MSRYIGAGSRLWLAALLLTTLSLAQSVGAVFGTVIGLDGNPLAHARITFQSTQDKAHTYTVKTNKKGKYGDYTLPFGIYTLSLYSASGKLLFTQKVRADVDPRKDDINLQKLSAARNETNHPATGSNGSGSASGPAVQTASSAQGNGQGAPGDSRAAAIAKAKAENLKIGQLNGMLQQANQMEQAKNFNGAIALLQKAVALDPQQDLVQANLALAYQRAGRYAEAIPVYQKAIALNPKVAGYYSNLASCQTLTGQGAQALASLQQAATLAPASAADTYATGANLFYEKGDAENGIIAANKAIQLNPNGADAYFVKGMLQVGKSTYNDKTGVMTPPPGTVAALRKYLQLAPNGPQAATVKQVLTTLKRGVSTSVHNH